MAFEVPDLPYDYNALEPHIDEQTMRVHHDKHHQAYVDKANAALEGTEWADKDVNEVLQNLSSLGDKETAVRNNAGGHSNHSFFWEIMSPDGGGEPDGDLASAINDAFGDFDSFKEEFKNAGVNQFGSGWAWLVHDGSGLAVVSTREPGLADLRRSDADPRLRRLGARLLPEVPEQAPGLHRRLVERRQLGEGGRALRSRELSQRRDRVAGRAASGRPARRPSVLWRDLGHRVLGHGGDRQARVDAGVGGDRRAVADHQVLVAEDAVAGVDDAVSRVRRRSPRRPGCGRSSGC